MKIDRIEYHRTYNLGNYCSEKIALEASFDQDTETLSEVFIQLKSSCDTLHRQNNPQLYPIGLEKTPASFESKTGIPYIYNSSQEPMFSTPTEEKIPPEKQEQNIISEIQKSNNKEELEALQLISNHSVKTKGEYKKRKKQLNII
jgi:hypothetical protein